MSVAAAGRRASGSRRDELLAVSRRLFYERGYEATSTRDLAASLGIRPGSLYHYVDAKEALLLEIVAAVQTPGTSAVSDVLAGGGSASDRLAALIRAHAKTTTEDPVGAAILLREVRALPAARRAQLVTEMRTYRGAVERLVEEGRQDGSLRSSLDPGITAMALLGALNWMHRWLRPGEPWPVDRLVDQLPGLLMRGISAGADVSEDAPAFVMPAGLPRDRRDRHGAIVDAAARLFVARGYESTTLAEIAETSGVSKPTLYHYVASKERLLFDLVRDRQERASAVIGALEALDADPRAKLVAAIRFHIHAITATPRETQLVLEQSRSLAVEHRAEMRRLQARYFDAFAAIVGAARPASEAEQAALPTLVALGACNWVYRWYRPGKWSADDVADGFADVLLQGIVNSGERDSV